MNTQVFIEAVHCDKVGCSLGLESENEFMAFIQLEVEDFIEGTLARYKVSCFG